MHKFKVYHQLFEYKLKPTSFRLYVTLSNMYYNRPKSFKIKLYNIAKNTGISVSTAQLCIKELERKGLIKKTPSKIRYKKGEQHVVINGINQYELKLLSGRFSLIETKLLKKIKSHSTFMVYFAIAKYVGNGTDKGFPSYTYIADLTGLSRSTSISKVKELVDLCYICKNGYIKLDNRHGHNNYTVFNSHKRSVLLSYILVAYKNFMKSLLKNVENFVESSLKTVENFIIEQPCIEKIKDPPQSLLSRAFGKVESFASKIPIFRKICVYIK